MDKTLIQIVSNACSIPMCEYYKHPMGMSGCQPIGNVGRRSMGFNNYPPITCMMYKDVGMCLLHTRFKEIRKPYIYIYIYIYYIKIILIKIQFWLIKIRYR